MVKLFTAFSLILLLFSCQEPQNHRQKSVKKTEAIAPVLFTDLIPQHLSDSAKINLIKHYVKRIENDSTLSHVTLSDSLNVQLHAFYRNDSLVKIIDGSLFPEPFETNLNPLRNRHTSYYFLKDSLIFSHYSCSSWMQTGRCSPVSISIRTSIYLQHILHQEVDNKIGPYVGCGCGFPPFGGQNDPRYVAQYFAQIKQVIERVKKAKLP